MKRIKKSSASITGALMLCAALILTAGMLVACGGKAGDGAVDGGSGESAALSGALTIEGSDTMVNLSQAWAESFMADNPEVMLTVKGGGSGAGIASLLNDTTDFANASRAVKDEEIEQGAANGVEVVQTAVARDGIAVIINSANGVDNISTEDLGKMYRGEITDWKEVGGSTGKIVLLGRDTSSGTYEFFQEAVVGKEAEYAKSMRNMQSNQAIVDEVKGNPQAIGYVGMGYEDPNTKVVNVDGVAATSDAVRDGSYALSRELFMDSNGTPAGLAKAFLDWILGSAGQQIVTDEGFVTLN